MKAADANSGKSKITLLKKLMTGSLLPVIVLVGGGITAIGLMETAPKAERRPPPVQARLVEVEKIHFAPERITIEAMGTVMPARQIDIKPRVSGQIIEVSDEFIPGGRLAAGEMLVKIDPSDYELIIRNRAGDVAQARSNLDLEMGQQTIAQQEYELLGEEITADDKELVLRMPQLMAAEALLEKANAALAQARLDYQRTTITTPFNALVRSRAVDLGVQVTTATTLATLCETDRFWALVAVPVDKLKWLDIPRDASAAGASARIYDETAWGTATFRHGRVIRLTGDLENEGRMAQLLVEIEDPLALRPENKGLPVIILDAYVRVEIDGVELPSVAAINRQLIRNGDNVWIMNPANQLEIRPVDVVYHGPDRIFIAGGVKEGERLVRTDLSAPIEGMLLRTRRTGDDLENDPLENPEQSGREQTSL